MEVKAIESDCNQEGARGFRNVSQDVANGQRAQPEPLFPQKWRTRQLKRSGVSVNEDEKLIGTFFLT